MGPGLKVYTSMASRCCRTGLWYRMLKPGDMVRSLEPSKWAHNLPSEQRWVVRSLMSEPEAAGRILYLNRISGPQWPRANSINSEEISMTEFVRRFVWYLDESFEESSKENPLTGRGAEERLPHWVCQEATDSESNCRDVPLVVP